ncbi:hypothetical protein PYW07_011876 [Mythimna separata]|uniref:Chitin-binding type-2 domain-containing protein n=1 Tax=Mythimna separata TaxID=271217 RepID=A0AAD7Y754_MYTSE|nr:hypothetical protein PYW07_011876 [Mythimna separata]
MIKTFLLLTGLALVQARSSGDAVVNSARLYVPHEDCPKEETHYLLPHEYDCTLFYYCIYGMKYNAPRGCAPGTEFDPELQTEFDPELQVCVHASESGCTLPGWNTTPGSGGSTAGPTAGPTEAPTAAPTGPTDPTVAPTAGPVPVSTPSPNDCETLANGCPADFSIHKLLPHEDYCHLFYYCDNGEKILRACDEPLYFNSELELCVWSWQTTCVNDGPYTYPPTAAPEIATTPEVEDFLENGCPVNSQIPFLLPHETCEKYYECDDGEKIERDCQTGTVFNPDIQACDWPSNVPQCEGSPGATAPPPAPEGEEPPLPDLDWEALPNGCPANFEIDWLLPHESECGLYYACDQGELIGLDCPAGLHFSPSRQICTWPAEAGCEFWTPDGCQSPLGDEGCTGSQKAVDTIVQESEQELAEEWEALPNGCPANYEIDFLLPHEDDCGKFYYCVHGGKVELSCADGTQFSTAEQRCVWPEEAGCAN